MNKKEYKDIQSIPNLYDISLKKYQKFIRNFVNINTLNNELFIFHKPGAGKTLSAVITSEMFRKNLSEINGKIIIVGSFISRQGFINTLISNFSNIANNISPDEANIFISEEEEKEIEELEMLDIVNKKYKMDFKKKKKKYIMDRLNDVGYIFMSYQKFMNNKLMNINNSLIIIDESHNLLNNNKYNQALKNLIESSERYKILLLTATPMFNKPQDIVNHSNMMFKKKDEIIYNKVFDKEGNIKEDGLLYLQKKLKGKVSYIRGNNPTFFPEAIEVGTILSKDSIADTKVIRVPMSDIQYETYKKNFNGQFTFDIKNISNFVLPNGIFKNIETKLKESSSSYKKKYGVKVVSSGANISIEGNVLKYNNLIKYSPKYARCLKDINNTNSGIKKGKCFVFNSFVNNSGIKLFGNILKENGYHIFIDNKNDKKYDYKRYVLYYQDTPKDIREKILKIYNSKENKYGKIIKILVGSTLTREGLDLKAVKHLFILNFQENFSRLDQIKGRGIRLNSHKDLPENERFTYVYKYVSSLPNKELSIEEIEYKKNEKDMIIIKKIERALKVIAVDCSFNKEFNVFKTDIDGSIECEFEECNYECKYSVPIEKDEEFDLTYKLFYKDEEIFEAKEYIKYLFRDNIVFNLNTILEKVSKKGILKDFVYIALEELVDEKTNFFRSKHNRGYIIKIESNYLFQPSGIDNTLIDINIRNVGVIPINKTTLLNELMLEAIDEESKMYIEDISIIRKKMKDKNYIDTSIIISKVGILGKIQLLEDAIKNYIEDKINNIDFHILKYFKRYLIDEKQIKTSLNNLNTDVYFNSISMNKIDKNKKFIGHFLSPVAKIYDSKDKIFKDITSDFIKRKTKRTYRENDFIIGFMDKDKKGELQFKIRYSGKESDLDDDKRKKKRGFVCRYTNNKKELINISLKLGIKEVYDKRSRRKIKICKLCELLEKDLREKQLFSDKNNLGVRWFYDYIL